MTVTNIKMAETKKVTLVPNVGVEILYRDTPQTANSLVIQEPCEVEYIYTDLGGNFYPEVIVTAMQDKRELARLPLAGLRRITFLY